MSIFVTNATPDLVYYVSINMRERDFREIRATMYEDTREQVAEGLAQQYGEFPFATCIGRDGVPIAILAGVNLRPGVWSMGLWATDDMPKIGKFLTKFCVNHYFPAMRKAGAHRVECKSIVGYNAIHKWLRFLGFAESEPEKMWGKRGEDFITFYWTEGMPWPNGYKEDTAVSTRSRLDQKSKIGRGDLCV